MMKKVVILLLFSAFALNSFAQSEVTVAPEKNVLKVNTLSLLVGTGSIFYEREISDLVSAQMGVGYMGYTLGKTKFSGLILTPDASFISGTMRLTDFISLPT